MHPHHIALADARAADLRRPTTRTTTAAAPRRCSAALALVGLLVIGAVAALAPSSALAIPSHDVGITGNAQAQTAPTPAGVAHPRQDLRSPDARDAAEARGTFNSPPIVVVKSRPQARPAPSSGLDWTDAGIGAGSLLALGLVALAGALLVTRHRRAAQATPGAGH